MEAGIFDSIVMLLILAVGVSALFQRLKLPTLLGYLVIGILVGPFALKLVPNSHAPKELAEFGVVFLLFSIGLEFSLSQLKAMRKVVFGLGSLQVLFTIILTTLIGMLLPMTRAEAIVIGCIVSVSSTAIVIKQLSDQLELTTPHGLNSVGILLFQDLAVVPIMILIPAFPLPVGTALPLTLIYALLKGLFAIAVILVGGHYVIRPLFYKIAGAFSLELFSLTALLVTLSAAWMTEHLGLSPALGAFMAGIMLGETEFRHQIEADIRPFRDVLLGLFFISIGMQFKTTMIVQAWEWVLLLLFALVVGKGILVSLLSYLFKNSMGTSLRTGIILGQGSEFGFAFLSLAMSYKILRPDYAQVALGGLVISMILSTLLIRYHNQIVNLMIRRIEPERAYRAEAELKKVSRGTKEHVLICGFGQVGQNVGYFLNQTKKPYLAMEIDPVRVEEATAEGHRVFYADATQYKVLEAMGIKRAKALVISFYHLHTSMKIIEQVRANHPKLPIFVRSKNDFETEQFYAKGVTEVIPDNLEISVTLGADLLRFLGVRKDRVNKLVEESHASRYNLIHGRT